MPRFDVAATPIEGVIVVERKLREDARGSLSRLFCADELREAGWRLPVAQVNHTLTRRRGTVRGMHYQHPPSMEDKYITCLRGEVFDVAVDLRRGSPTFLEWHAVQLSPANRRSLLVPHGCAHGFQTLTDDCELVYLHSHPYAAADEAAVNALDPCLGIAWPLEISDRSPRDVVHPFLPEDFAGVSV